MARPTKHRRIRCNPVSLYFKPRGIPMYKLKEVTIDHHELEALRLADVLNFTTENAAKKIKLQ
jgi:predicted DNA-binding protein (UPF0251 family)